MTVTATSALYFERMKAGTKAKIEKLTLIRKFSVKMTIYGQRIFV